MTIDSSQDDDSNNTQTRREYLVIKDKSAVQEEQMEIISAFVGGLTALAHSEKRDQRWGEV